MIDIKEHDGWEGAFTRAQAPQAYFKNGARIVKNVNEKGDSTPLGVEGVVLGSIYAEGQGMGTGYFVEWDNRPRVACFVIAWKLAKACSSK
jgi:hypothetical protein